MHHNRTRLQYTVQILHFSRYRRRFKIILLSDYFLPSLSQNLLRPLSGNLFEICCIFVEKLCEASMKMQNLLNFPFDMKFSLHIHMAEFSLWALLVMVVSNMRYEEWGKPKMNEAHCYCAILRNQPNLHFSVMIALSTPHCMLVEPKTRVAAVLLCFHLISISAAHQVYTFSPPGFNHHNWYSTNIPSWDWEFRNP